MLMHFSLFKENTLTTFMRNQESIKSIFSTMVRDSLLSLCVAWYVVSVVMRLHACLICMLAAILSLYPIKPQRITRSFFVASAFIFFPPSPLFEFNKKTTLIFFLLLLFFSPFSPLHTPNSTPHTASPSHSPSSYFFLFLDLSLFTTIHRINVDNSSFDERSSDYFNFR